MRRATFAANMWSRNDLAAPDSRGVQGLEGSLSQPSMRGLSIWLRLHPLHAEAATFTVRTDYGLVAAFNLS